LGENKMKAVGIIGCGNMGEALVKGILSTKLVSRGNIYVSDKKNHKAKKFQRKFKVNISTNEKIAKKCKTIIIAVKPQDSKKLLSSLSMHLNKSTSLVSVMAGVSISKIERGISKKLAITRAMPNMAALIGQSITCLSYNSLVKNKIDVKRIFYSLGDVVELDERFMDAVTAISGSGPAYFFYLVEILTKSGIQFGLKKHVAAKLATKTALGSAVLLDCLGLDAGILRKRVTSKGGTTEAAFKVFKRKKLGNVLQSGFRKAKERSKQLYGG